MNSYFARKRKEEVEPVKLDIEEERALLSPAAQVVWDQKCGPIQEVSQEEDLNEKELEAVFKMQMIKTRTTDLYREMLKCKDDPKKAAEYKLEIRKLGLLGDKIMQNELNHLNYSRIDKMISERRIKQREKETSMERAQ